MRLLFTEQEREGNGFHDYHLGRLLRYYCEYHNIYIGEENLDFTIHWNNFHKVFIFSLMNIEGNKNGSDHFEKVVELLSRDHKVGFASTTWRWDHKVTPAKYIPGVQYNMLPYKGEM